MRRSIIRSDIVFFSCPQHRGPGSCVASALTAGSTMGKIFESKSNQDPTVRMVSYPHATKFLIILVRDGLHGSFPHWGCRINTRCYDPIHARTYLHTSMHVYSYIRKDP